MEYKALITKQIAFADESIRINIESDDDFRTFKSKVEEACTFCDYRAHLLGFRLFEDTSLTAQLSEGELQACEEAARLLFPDEKLRGNSTLKDGVKFEVAKITANGESVTLQIHNPDTYENVNTAMKHLWDLLDARLTKSNSRQLEHMEYTRSLPYETKLKVAMIMDILYGRAATGQVVERLKEGTEEEYIQEQLKNTPTN